jgi:hypothetical protein
VPTVPSFSGWFIGTALQCVSSSSYDCGIVNWQSFGAIPVVMDVKFYWMCVENLSYTAAPQLTSVMHSIKADCILKLIIVKWCIAKKFFPY